jgi:hypothetical protein
MNFEEYLVPHNKVKTIDSFAGLKLLEINPLMKYMGFNNDSQLTGSKICYVYEKNIFNKSIKKETVLVPVLINGVRESYVQTKDSYTVQDAEIAAEKYIEVISKLFNANILETLKDSIIDNRRQNIISDANLIASPISLFIDFDDAISRLQWNTEIMRVFLVNKKTLTILSEMAINGIHKDLVIKDSELYYFSNIKIVDIGESSMGQDLIETTEDGFTSIFLVDLGETGLSFTTIQENGFNCHLPYGQTNDYPASDGGAEFIAGSFLPNDRSSVEISNVRISQ